MLTRKDFVKIANAFAETKGPYEDKITDDLAQSMRKYLANSIADVCQDSNPRFDRHRFLDACEVPYEN